MIQDTNSTLTMSVNFPRAMTQILTQVLVANSATVSSAISRSAPSVKKATGRNSSLDSVFFPLPTVLKDVPYALLTNALLVKRATQHSRGRFALTALLCSPETPKESVWQFYGTVQTSLIASHVLLESADFVSRDSLWMQSKNVLLLLEQTIFAHRPLKPHDLSICMYFYYATGSL